MGIAGLILGILGAIGSFIPGMVYGSWVLALVGIIVSAIGMKKAKAANQPNGTAIAGLVLSIIGFVIAIPRLICAIACASAIGSIGSSIGGY
jgi:putative exporter of polyketide antibiotics